jgi:glycosyltransferase involved in cell wall biosynthesis
MPTIPERADLRREMLLSLEAQTLERSLYEVIVSEDPEHRGCSWAVNQGVARAKGEFLLIVPDDDLLLPPALEMLLEQVGEGDIIYSPPLVRQGIGDHFWGEPPEIPSFGLMRRSLFLELGGYDESARREEDRKLWMKALEAGKTFVRIPRPLWVYGFNFDDDGKLRNKSYNQGVSR